MRKLLCSINQFYIKIMAIVFMTLDHVGVFLMGYSTTYSFANPMYTTGYVFRCIGRLAFPLFILMLVEGVIHTRNEWKYLLRIGVIALAIMVAQIVIYYCIDTSIESATSPFLDLFIAALTLILLKRKDKFSFLAILPIAYSVLVTGVYLYESMNGTTITWLPFYLRSNYSILGIVVALLFYLAHYIADKKCAKEMIETNSVYHQNLVNLYQSLFLLAINIIFYAIAMIQINGHCYFDLYNIGVQSWSMIAAVIILMYNGQRGYNKPWFKYGSYLYFPVHIVIIFLIFFLIYK